MQAPLAGRALAGGPRGAPRRRPGRASSRTHRLFGKLSASGRAIADRCPQLAAVDHHRQRGPPRATRPAPRTAISMRGVEVELDCRSSSRGNCDRCLRLAASAPRLGRVLRDLARPHHRAHPFTREPEGGAYMHTPTDPSKQIGARQRPCRALGEGPGMRRGRGCGARLARCRRPLPARAGIL
jgi:hypothetical protein